MKVISKTQVATLYIEHYNLDETWPLNGSNRGLVICYALATSKAIRLISLELEGGEEEVGASDLWHRRYDLEEFRRVQPSLEHFLWTFDFDECHRWTLVADCQNAELIVDGTKDSTLVGASYPLNTKLNLLRLFSDIETESYHWNDCDPDLMKHLRENYHFTEKRAVQAILKLQRHPDLLAEFKSAAASGGFPPDEQAIHVEGFTARELNERFPLSQLGAYNYLIYLRERPKDALEDLRKGLPRR